MDNMYSRDILDVENSILRVSHGGVYGFSSAQQIMVTANAEAYPSAHMWLSRAAAVELMEALAEAVFIHDLTRCIAMEDENCNGSNDASCRVHGKPQPERMDFSYWDKSTPRAADGTALIWSTEHGFYVRDLMAGRS